MIPFQTLSHLSEAMAKARGDAPFITQLDMGLTLSYRQLWTTSQVMAAQLAELGVHRGSCILQLAKNHWSLYPLLVAAGHLGAIVVPFDPAAHPDELDYVTKHSQPVVTLTGSQQLHRGKDFGHVVGLEAFVASAVQPQKAMVERQGGASDQVLMVYTSGTTGNPKGVMLSQANILADATLLSNFYNISSLDRFFCVLPTVYVNGIIMTGFTPFVKGAQIFLSDVFSIKNAKFYWQNVAQHGITICSLVPSIMALMLDLFPAGRGVDSPSARFAFCGGAPLAPELWKGWEERFKLPLCQGYGLSETTCWAVATSEFEKRNYSAVGRALGTEVKIQPLSLEDSGAGSDSFPMAGQEQFGEVLIRGPQVMMGYFRDAEKTKEAFTEDGFFRSGDLGCLDENGYLHLRGRIKDIIIKNGENVSAVEVDNVVQQHSAVAESKTVGVPDSHAGELIVSACVIKDGVSISGDEIRQWTRERLSVHKVPDRVVLMKYLPKSASAGKYQIGLLRKIMSGGAAAEISRALTGHDDRVPTKARDFIQKSILNGEPLCVATYWCLTGQGAEETRRGVAWLIERTRSARVLPRVPVELTLVVRNVGRPNAAADIALLREVTADAARVLVLSELGQSPAPTQAPQPGLIDSLSDASMRCEVRSATPVTVAEALVRQAPQVAAATGPALWLSFDSPAFDALLPPLPKLHLRFNDGRGAIAPWEITESAP